VVEAACEAISDSGTGVGAGLVGLGFDVAAEDCWASALFPFKTQQNMMNKLIWIARCMTTKSEASAPSVLPDEADTVEVAPGSRIDAHITIKLD
jgi:hypothetical protein